MTPPTFHDSSGRPWQYSLAAGTGSDIARLAREVPSDFRRLLTSREHQTLIIPAMVRGPDGQRGEHDADLRAWIASPETDLAPVLALLCEAVGFDPTPPLEPEAASLTSASL